MTFHKLAPLAAAVIGIGLAGPAAAQFDPAFNHLKCYRIKGPRVEKVFLAENQFGRERIVKLTPLFLCTPTKKICCSNPATVAGCDQVPCLADPTPNQPAAVDHFKCYKIGVKFCDPSSVACTTLAKAPKGIQATLVNQFGTEDVLIGPAKMLCTPVLKIVTTNTTTTTQTTTTITQTTTTTTTTIPCRDVAQPGMAPMCAGDCPAPLACVFVSAVGCTCEIPCALQGATCNNQFCPKAGQQCIANATSQCGCCFPQIGTPCTADSDCCFGNCMGGTCPGP